MNFELGKTLVIIGIVCLIAGLVFMLFSKAGLPKLPGDILIKKDNFTFYFPLATSILISIVLSIIFALFFRK